MLVGQVTPILPTISGFIKDGLVIRLELLQRKLDDSFARMIRLSNWKKGKKFFQMEKFMINRIIMVLI